MSRFSTRVRPKVQRLLQRKNSIKYPLLAPNKVSSRARWQAATLLLMFMAACGGGDDEPDSAVLDAGVRVDADTPLDGGQDGTIVDANVQDSAYDAGPDVGPIGHITFQDGDFIQTPSDLTTLGEELADLVHAVTGLALVVVENAPDDSRRIILSLGCSLPKNAFELSSPSELEFIICGSNVGVQYGVHEFAERELGIRWLFPGADGLGTYMPTRTSLEVQRLNRREAPAYVNRRFSVGRVSSDYAPWATRMRMTSSEAEFHHNLYNVFPPARYRTTHPEFYPVAGDIRYPEEGDVGGCATDGGRACIRENHTWQPVLRADGLLDEGIANVRQYFEDQPSVTWFSLGMNDSLTWGDAQLSGHPRNSLGFVDMSDDYFPWAGELATAVLETHPGKRFGLLAYHNLVDPPSSPIHESLVPYITYDRMQWIDPARRAADETRTTRWNEMATEIGWYDYVYGDQPTMYAAPRMYPHLMAEYLQFGREHNVRHYYAEAYPSTEYWREGPKLYVLAKLLWDPDVDVDALLEDWYLAAVGPAAAPYLANYYTFWETFWMDRVPETPWFQNSRWDYLPFAQDGYLEILTLADRTYLREQISAMQTAAAGTEFESRAVFFARGAARTEALAMGARFDFEAGRVAAGFGQMLHETMEGTLGQVPMGWSFWNRSGAGSTIVSRGLTDTRAAMGTSSFETRLNATGEAELAALLYRAVAMEGDLRYCLRAQVSSESDFVMSLSFRETPGSGRNDALGQRMFAATGGEWQTKVVCTELPADSSFTEMTVWLGMETSAAGAHQVAFDEVELFSAP